MSQHPPMDTMTTALDSAFRSARLTYRAIEDSEADKAFMYTHLSDTLTHALSDPSIHRPVNRKTSDEKTMGRWGDKHMLAVMICITDTDADKDTTADDKKPELALEPIGGVWIKDGKPYQRRGQLGIRIAAKYQNKGYGLEAVNWAMDWAFRWGGLHSLALGASLYNERAVAVYKKAGFKVEGVSREAIYRDRKWLDSVQMAILEHEWEELRGVKQ
ncbi:acyl-CoA N-acyltransferase [Astrocystis sublimbata]|nr:acyl-CoA N-acyltransferase [Astrocystis sublimbata]